MYCDPPSSADVSLGAEPLEGTPKGATLVFLGRRTVCGSFGVGPPAERLCPATAPELARPLEPSGAAGLALGDSDCHNSVNVSGKDVLKRHQ